MSEKKNKNPPKVPNWEKKKARKPNTLIGTKCIQQYPQTPYVCSAKVAL